MRELRSTQYTRRGAAIVGMKRSVTLRVYHEGGIRDEMVMNVGDLVNSASGTLARCNETRNRKVCSSRPRENSEGDGDGNDGDSPTDWGRVEDESVRSRCSSASTKPAMKRDESHRPKENSQMVMATSSNTRVLKRTRHKLRRTAKRTMDPRNSIGMVHRLSSYLGRGLNFEVEGIRKGIH